MKRRDFLKLLFASASAQFVDYEKLLWIPGEKKIFLPPAPLLKNWDTFWNPSEAQLQFFREADKLVLYGGGYGMGATKLQAEIMNKVIRRVRAKKGLS